MSIIKFELKQEHLNLLKNLSWSIDKNNNIINNGYDGDEYKPPFGLTTIYEGMDLCLNGKSNDIDYLTYDELPEYSEEQKAIFDKLYSELPMAISIILTTGQNKLGLYKTKYEFINWEKID